MSTQAQQTQAKITIGVEELGAILGKAKQTIYKDLGRNPAALPPPLRIPGSNRTRWLMEDVQAWLCQCRTFAPAPAPASVPHQPRRRGAPTKAEHLDRARKEGGAA